MLHFWVVTFDITESLSSQNFHIYYEN